MRRIRESENQRIRESENQRIGILENPPILLVLRFRFERRTA